MPEGDRPTRRTPHSGAAPAAASRTARSPGSLVVARAGAAAGRRLALRPRRAAGASSSPPDPRRDPAAVAAAAGARAPGRRPTPAPVAAAAARAGADAGGGTPRARPADSTTDGSARRVGCRRRRTRRRVRSYREGPAVVTPASTMKLLTSLAALRDGRPRAPLHHRGGAPGRGGSPWSAAATRCCAPAGRPRRVPARRRTCATLARHTAQALRGTGGTGVCGCATTTRCSPARRRAPPGSRTTCPTTWSARSPRCGSTRAASDAG